MLQFAGALYNLHVVGGDPEREGQGLVEYALILAFIAILVVVAMTFFKDQLLVIYSRIGNSIPQS